MPKRDLHRFHVHTPLPFRQRQGRKLVIRLVRDSKDSILEEREFLPVGRADDARPVHPSALVPTRKRPRNQFWNWSLLWLTVLSLLGGTLASGLLLLTKLPPPTNCQRISPLSPDSERLYCAQLAAESGKLEPLVTAIRLVQHWPREHPLYSEAQRLTQEWSKMILEIAQKQINQGDSSGAVKTLEQIPITSPLYPEAQAQIATWRQEWQQAEKIISQFKDALIIQNWSQASKLITALSQLNNKYWNNLRVDLLMKQLGAEKQAWQQLEEARDLAKSNQLDQLEKAIALAAKIAPNSYVKAQAQTELSKWSRTLLNISATRFDQQNFVGMVEVAQRIPINTALYQEAQDWIRLGRAAQTAKPDNLLSLVDALTAVRQISPKSPVHPKASNKATLWESQLQDTSQLLLAQLAASFEQRTTINYAIAQASLIAPTRPQRQQAQNLIAQWRKEIQEIQDRNTLSTAQNLAQSGTIDQLKAAVALASQIKLGQPLRLNAQNAIAKWTGQIQAIEDQPILDLAEALAQRRDLIAAISTAAQIRPGRTLYPEAQKVISQWVAQVQTAQDYPILEAAAALAAQGRFDAAIATAAQIPPQRALYSQAQAAIALWKSQSIGVSGQN